MAELDIIFNIHVLFVIHFDYVLIRLLYYNLCDIGQLAKRDGKGEGSPLTIQVILFLWEYLYSVSIIGTSNRFVRAI